MNGLTCDKCGKVMIHNEQSIFGIKFELNWTGKTAKEAEFSRRQLGKYAPKDANDMSHTVEFCWECTVDAFMRT